MDKEEYNSFYDDRLQHEDTRQRIINVVCNCTELDAKIESICDKKIKGFDKDLKIEAYSKIIDTWKYWVPTGIAGLMGVAGIIASIYSSLN